MTVHQRIRQGDVYREVPDDRPMTASGDGRPCFPVTGRDVADELGCVGCGAPFEHGSYYTERPTGRTPDGDEVVEVLCLRCAAGKPDDLPPVQAAAGLGQDRDLPDPDGWVRCSIPVVVVEGMATGDGRRLDPEALTHRALPHALMALSQTTEGGHLGASLFGRIDSLERFNGPDVVNIDTGEPFPEGTYVWTADEVYVNPAHPDYAHVYYGALSGVSVDLAETVADFEFDEDNPDDEGLLVLRSGRIAAATVCTIPAFPGAHIVLPPDAPAPTGGRPTETIAASSAPGRAFRLETEGALCASCVSPPALWFDDPGLTEPTPLQVDDDGRVFGHLADFTTCHVGLPGCQTAPRSRSGYSYFLTGYVLTSDGVQVPVGQLTMGTGHAGLDDDLSSAASHYDNTGTAVADVAVGEDDHGIWFSGALRPGVTDEQVRVLRASPLSGDWRPIGGGHELVAALAVNTPGFPVSRIRARVASGVTNALIAAAPFAPQKESSMAPPPPPKKTDGPPRKGEPGQEKPSDSPAAEPGDLVKVDAGGDLLGTVVGADEGSVTVEVVVESAMVSVTEPEDAASAAGMSEDDRRMLRSVRAGQVLAMVRPT